MAGKGQKRPYGAALAGQERVAIGIRRDGKGGMAEDPLNGFYIRSAGKRGGCAAMAQAMQGNMGIDASSSQSRLVGGVQAVNTAIIAVFFINVTEFLNNCQYFSANWH